MYPNINRMKLDEDSSKRRRIDKDNSDYLNYVDDTKMEDNQIQKFKELLEEHKKLQKENNELKELLDSKMSKITNLSEELRKMQIYK